LESPFSGLAKDRKIMDAELIRAIPFVVTAEYEVTQMMNHKYLISITQKTNIVK
jgi:hypothetical protein